MKKVWLLSLSIMFASASFSQENIFSLGFNVSPNIGWLSVTDTDIEDDYSFDHEGSTARMGFAYGLMVEYHFTENYHLSASVNHLMTGGRFTGTNTETGDLTLPTVANQDKVYFATNYSPVKLNYLHIPVGLRLKTNEIGYFRYFGNLGFAGAFGIGSKTDVNLSYYEFDEANNTAVAETDVLRENTEFQARFLSTFFTVGAGAQYSMGGNTLLHFGLDVNIGLGNIVSKNEYQAYNNISENMTAKNSYVALNVGIFL